MSETGPKNSGGENKEPNGEQLDSEAEILSEMRDDFDPDAAAERVKEKKEELVEESEETEPNEELERVDEQINEDIAEDIGTEKITIEKTEDVVKEESEAIVEEVVFDAERAVDGKQFERFFTPEEEKEIYVNALKEDVAKFEGLLTGEEESLAEEQAKKLGILDFSGRSSKRFAINAINRGITEYKQELEKAQKRLDEADSLSPKEISKKLGDWVQGDVRAAWSVIYDNEKTLIVTIKKTK